MRLSIRYTTSPSTHVEKKAAHRLALEGLKVIHTYGYLPYPTDGRLVHALVLTSTTL